MKYIYIANLNLHDKREACSLRSLANKYIYIYINIGKIRIIQQTREARSARQLENATALGLAYPAARSYNT